MFWSKQGLYDDSDCDSAELDHSGSAEPSQPPANWWKHDTSTHSDICRSGLWMPLSLLPDLRNTESLAEKQEMKVCLHHEQEHKTNQKSGVPAKHWTIYFLFLFYKYITGMWNWIGALQGDRAAASSVLSIAADPRSALQKTHEITPQWQKPQSMEATTVFLCFLSSSISVCNFMS